MTPIVSRERTFEPVSPFSVGPDLVAESAPKVEKSGTARGKAGHRRAAVDIVIDRGRGAMGSVGPRTGAA
jgi:hypothetical protein